VTTTTKFTRCLPIILAAEGGYSNVESDPGGETNFGISKRAYPGEDIAALTVERAATIYRRDYWGECEALPWPLDLYHFDAKVNSGPRRAAQWLLVSQGDPEAYLVAREGFLTRLVARKPALRVFRRGWANRIAHLRRVGHLDTTPPTP
jgi:lysozyme family protein